MTLNDIWMFVYNWVDMVAAHFADSPSIEKMVVTVLVVAVLLIRLSWIIKILLWGLVIYYVQQGGFDELFRYTESHKSNVESHKSLPDMFSNKNK
jgi:hypothetical protein